MNVATNTETDIEIGSGEFGKIYKRVLPDGTFVAVKKPYYPGSETDDNAVLAMEKNALQYEIVVLQRVTHALADSPTALTHITPYISHMSHGTQGQCELVMQYFESTSVYSRVFPKNRTFSPDHVYVTCEELKCIVQQVAYTLRLIQKNMPWFRHGDLHADNVLIDATGHIKIIDFGTADCDKPANQTTTHRSDPLYDVLYLCERMTRGKFARDPEDPGKALRWLTRLCGTIGTRTPDWYCKSYGRVDGGFDTECKPGLTFDDLDRFVANESLLVKFDMPTGSSEPGPRYEANEAKTLKQSIAQKLYEYFGKLFD